MNIGNRDPRVTEYIAGSSLYFQELINTLTDIVFEAEPNMDEAIKWNRITFTVNGNWNQMRDNNVGELAAELQDACPKDKEGGKNIPQ